MPPWCIPRRRRDGGMGTKGRGREREGRLDCCWRRYDASMRRQTTYMETCTWNIIGAVDSGKEGNTGRVVKT